MDWGAGLFLRPAAGGAGRGRDPVQVGRKILKAQDPAVDLSARVPAVIFPQICVQLRENLHIVGPARGGQLDIGPGHHLAAVQLGNPRRQRLPRGALVEVDESRNGQCGQKRQDDQDGDDLD